MKKALAIILISTILLITTNSLADFDINSLSFDELVALVNEAQMLMMKTDQWKEVKVPEGTYQIGRDIPAGYWTITAADNSIVGIAWGTATNESGIGIDFKHCIGGTTLTGRRTNMYNEGVTYQISYNLEEGQFIDIMYGGVVFTPYQGNSFDFE